MPLDSVKKEECWVEVMSIAPDPEEGVCEGGICVWVLPGESEFGWLRETRGVEVEVAGSLLCGE